MRERAFSNSITPSHYVIAHANVPGLRVCSLYAETSLLLALVSAELLPSI